MSIRPAGPPVTTATPGIAPGLGPQPSTRTSTTATITDTPSSAYAAIACHWFPQNPGRARFARVPALGRLADPVVVVGHQLICLPEIARATTSRWISEVPSKIV